MKSEVLSQINSIYLPITACLLFVLIFGSMLWWINRTPSKKLYKQVENLPLEDGVPYESK
jgi:hypothetical protein